jgi:hypothetical protein
MNLWMVCRIYPSRSQTIWFEIRIRGFFGESEKGGFCASFNESEMGCQKARRGCGSFAGDVYELEGLWGVGKGGEGTGCGEGVVDGYFLVFSVCRYKSAPILHRSPTSILLRRDSLLRDLRNTNSLRPDASLRTLQLRQ